MKIDTLFRHFREAYRGVRRNSWSFASISAVAVTLFIFGIFLLVAFNGSYMAKELEKEISVSVSIKPSVSQQQQRDLQKSIEAMAAVKEAELIPKSQAIKMMKSQLGSGKEDIFEEMEGEEENNPFPDVIKVQPKDPKKIPQLEKELKKMTAQVDHVESAWEVTGKLARFSTWAQTVVFIFGTGLAVLSAFLISNTIKLTIIARRSEIEIQRLVGASNWFIRWPFFIEGAFIGLVGAIFPTLVVVLLYRFFFTAIGGSEENPILKLMPMTELFTNMSICILVLGALIGVLGSILSVRRFLRV